MGKRLPEKVSVADLIFRNPVAYNYRTASSVVIVKDLVFWRLYDLLRQSFHLSNKGMILGARILLRAAIETLCVLVFLNKKIENVSSGKMRFTEFEKSVSQILLGTKNPEGNHFPINILTVIDQADKKYTGFRDAYDHLSESAHPNLDGFALGYGRTRKDANCAVGLVTTSFGNFWEPLFGDAHLVGIEMCITAFEEEYDNVFPTNLRALEKWIEENDHELRSGSSDGSSLRGFPPARE